MAKTTSSNNLWEILQKRFESNMHRHPQVKWTEVLNKLEKNKQAYEALDWMEETEGEPDVVLLDGKNLYFVDCSAESPKGRRSLCYDLEAWEKRKANKPEGSAVETALEHGTRILDESEYLYLQSIEAFDQKTSSWLLTPKEVRSLGGAIFGDRRFGRVFIYHNGADAYYSARGFRVKFKL